MKTTEVAPGTHVPVHFWCVQLIPSLDTYHHHRLFEREGAHRRWHKVTPPPGVNVQGSVGYSAPGILYIYVFSYKPKWSRFRKAKAVGEIFPSAPCSAPTLFPMRSNRAFLKVGPGGVLSCATCGMHGPGQGVKRFTDCAASWLGNAKRRQFDALFALRTENPVD